MSAPWILIVEDEPLLGELLSDNLGHEGYGTELVTDGKKALERIETGGIDLVILDLMLPKMSGLQILKKVRETGNEIPVLILSARSRDVDRIKGLDLGADDYLGKPFNLKELLLRVRALLRRSTSQGDRCHAKMEFAGNTIDFETNDVITASGEHYHMSQKEAMLLRLMLGNPGRVISRREILDSIWGINSLPTTRTVDNYIARFRKLFESDQKAPKHFHTLRGVGYRFEP